VADPLVITRLAFFFSMLLIIATAEKYRPRRIPCSKKRWPGHFAMVLVATISVRLIVPVGALGASVYAEQQGAGLLQIINLPYVLITCVGYILLEIVIYFQHRLSHKVPLLWRFHRMHHSDTEFDFTTALRFHPFEIIFSTFVKIAAILALGIPALAVIIFEIALNATAIFNHGNIKIPKKVEKKLRYFLVTPEMHRIHHSRIPRETDSNYSFSLSCWDRIFGTYTEKSYNPQQTMEIGLDKFRKPDDQRFSKLLLQPFQKDITAVK
jgi:sterol desaturase/sphingolipid hydroxylase (fatty acid hydroxylase superfamily)